MQMRKKHGYAECLKYMQMIEEGTSIHAIHMKYSINEDRLHVLWNRYQSGGRSGLIKRKNIRADFALKKEIVLDIEENHLNDIISRVQVVGTAICLFKCGSTTVASFTSSHSHCCKTRLY